MLQFILIADQDDLREPLVTIQLKHRSTTFPITVDDFHRLEDLVSEFEPPWKPTQD